MGGTENRRIWLKLIFMPTLIHEVTRYFACLFIQNHKSSGKINSKQIIN